jgi:hypothetical protein
MYAPRHLDDFRSQRLAFVCYESNTSRSRIRTLVEHNALDFGGHLMAQFELEPISVDDARRMVRVGRMDPEMHQRLAEALQQMAEKPEQAFLLKLPDDMKYNTARIWLARLAAQREMPLIIRKSGGGKAIVFWRASDNELQQRRTPPPRQRKAG